MKIFSVVIIALIALISCQLGSDIIQDHYDTALALSNPTNNQIIYNPADIAGSYFDEGHSLDSVTIYYTPNYGGVTNTGTATPFGNQTIKSFSGTLAITTAGFYYVWAQAVNSDNKTTISPKVLVQAMGDMPNTNNYDFTPPLVSISLPENNQTVSADFSVSGIVSDNKSGVKSVWLQLDNSVFSQVAHDSGNWSTNLHISIAGDHQIRVFASDHSNNISLTNLISVNHVAGLPSIIISKPQNNLVTNSSTINVQGTTSIDPGTISMVAVKVNNGSYSPANGTSSWSLNSLNLPLEGTNTITALAVSGSSVSNTVQIKVLRDTVLPGLALSNPSNGQIFKSGQVSMSGTASDNGSGIDKIRIGIEGSFIDAVYNNGSWSGTLALGDGPYTLKAYAIDKAHNVSIIRTLSIVVDSAAPVLSINSIPASSTNSVLNVSGTCSDATTGIKAIYLSLNNAAFIQANGTTPWNKDLSLVLGLNTIRIYAQDNAGNLSATNTLTINRTSANGFTVYFKKPAAWPGAYIHYWPLGNAWASKPAMINAGSGWYSWTFNDYSSTNFLFANASGTNVSSQTADFHRNISGYYWTNNQWYETNPEDATYPILTISAPYDYREVSSPSLYVLGTAAGGGGITGVYLSVNNGAYVSATGSSSWTYNVSLTMGTNTVKVYAMGNSGYSTATNLIHIIRKSGTGNNHPGTYSGKLGAHVYADGVEFSIWWRPSLVDQVYVKGDFNGWNQTATPLTRISSGNDSDIWWVFVPGANAGDEYRLVGKKNSTYTSVIDPASQYNRYDGGNSVIVNHSTFNWTDSGWSRPSWQDYIIYEMHVKDFSEPNAGHNPPFSTSNPGKYKGVVDGLTYLTNLGITAIELMPPSEFGDAGYSWGYNTALFFAVESGYASIPNSGQLGVDEMKYLINKAHEYGVAVIFDMVFNHTGGSNPFWNIDRVAYFDWDGDGTVEAQSGGDDSTPWGNHFNTKHPAVKRYGKEVLEYFMTEYHVDGFRFDASHSWFIDHQFLKDMKSHCTAIDPKVFFVYENLPNESDMKTWGGQWNDYYHDLGVQVYRGEKNFGDMKWNIEAIPDWANSSVEKVNYVESHDEDTLGYHAFDPTYGVGFDSGTAEARSRMMAVMLYTSVGIPMQWMGQECLTRTEGQNTDDAAFIWGSHSSLISYYGGVIRLRRDHPALKSGNISTMYAPAAGQNFNVYAYQRWASGDNTFVVVLNSDRWNSHTVNIAFPGNGTWTKVITEAGINGTSTINVSGNSATITIGANSGIIFMK